jgi:large subunit ribosomal protein L32
MAVPKRRKSKSRTNIRWAGEMKLTIPNVIKCPKCGEPTESHRMCTHCGQYHGRVVKEVVEET